MKRKVVVFLSGLCFLVGTLLCLISSLVPFDKFSLSEDLTALAGIIFILFSVFLIFYTDTLKE